MASAAFAEEASLLSSAIARAVKVRDDVDVGELKERKCSRRAEGARRLFATVEAVAMVERYGCGSRCGELNGAARTGNIHVEL